MGRGGLGVVYEAFADGERIALKLLNQSASDTIAARRLAREFRELSVIEHRNVVRVLDAGVHEDHPYLVMEYVDGSPLRRYLDYHWNDSSYRMKPPPPPEDSSSITRDATISEPGLAWLNAEEEPDSLPSPVRAARRTAPQLVEALPKELQGALNKPSRLLRLRDVIAQICDGLACIHARGLVHRDVKPSNVLVDEESCAKLVDFGLVKRTLQTGNTTAVGQVVGTYRYMSPEQARGGRVDGRSDLYSVGSVLYEMLSSRPPFLQTRTPDLLHAIVYETPPPVRSLNTSADPVLADIAERLLHKSPDARFASAVEVARRIRASKRQ